MCLPAKKHHFTQVSMNQYLIYQQRLYEVLMGNYFSFQKEVNSFQRFDA